MNDKLSNGERIDFSKIIIITGKLGDRIRLEFMIFSRLGSLHSSIEPSDFLTGSHGDKSFLSGDEFFRSQGFLDLFIRKGFLNWIFSIAAAQLTLQEFVLSFSGVDIVGLFGKDINIMRIQLEVFHNVFVSISHFLTDGFTMDDVFMHLVFKLGSEAFGVGVGSH